MDMFLMRDFTKALLSVTKVVYKNLSLDEAFSKFVEVNILPNCLLEQRPHVGGVILCDQPLLMAITPLIEGLQRTHGQVYICCRQFFRCWDYAFFWHYIVPLLQRNHRFLLLLS